MVHQYKNNGYNIVLDVNSGAIHVVDDVTYDVIELFEDNSAKEIIEKLVGHVSTSFSIISLAELSSNSSITSYVTSSTTWIAPLLTSKTIL